MTDIILKVLGRIFLLFVSYYWGSFLLVAYFDNDYAAKFIKEHKQAAATITDTTKTRLVSFTFTVNGKKYSGSATFVVNSCDVLGKKKWIGQKYIVYYLEDAPSSFHSLDFTKPVSIHNP
jgi:hypothetical protein